MKQPTYEKCQYLSIGQSPYKSTIERALLIPQLLDPTQIVDAKRLCEKCRQIFVERRQAIRIQRPLRVIITRRDQEASFHATILNVSSSGALVKLENLPNFHMDEKLRLKIYSYSGVSDKSDTDAIRVNGAVKRLAESNNEIAIVFVEESSLEQIVNIQQNQSLNRFSSLPSTEPAIRQWLIPTVRPLLILPPCKSILHARFLIHET